jgi:hypothetical protein
MRTFCEKKILSKDKRMRSTEVKEGAITWAEKRDELKKAREMARCNLTGRIPVYFSQNKTTVYLSPADSKYRTKLRVLTERFGSPLNRMP